jgi:hypothetical protein
MISKKYSYLILLFSWGCKSSIVQYKISDKYVGPCVVFVVPEHKLNKDGKIVIVKNGLGVISNVEVRNEFIFKSVETDAEMKIIGIGKEKDANNFDRYIYGLGKETKSSNCTYSEINFVSFFIGRKTEFETWNQKYRDELDYLDSTGRDWCDYYKSYLGNDNVSNK